MKEVGIQLQMPRVVGDCPSSYGFSYGLRGAWNVVFRRTTSSYGLLPTCTLGDIQPELVLAHAGIDPPLAHGMAAAGYYQSNKGAESHEHTELHARAAEQADDVSYSQVSTVHVPDRDRKTARPLPVTDTAAPMRR